MNLINIEKFWERIEIDDNDCWNWTKGLGGAGYGRFHTKENKMVLPHRFSYELFIGFIPEGKQIDHLCNNKKCSNPDHLEAVTAIENTHRSPNHCANRTHCPQGHPYSGDNLQIQQTGKRKGKRTCRKCHNYNTRKYYEKIPRKC